MLTTGLTIYTLTCICTHMHTVLNCYTVYCVVKRTWYNTRGMLPHVLHSCTLTVYDLCVCRMYVVGCGGTGYIHVDNKLTHNGTDSVYPLPSIHMYILSWVHSGQHSYILMCSPVMYCVWMVCRVSALYSECNPYEDTKIISAIHTIHYAVARC